MAEVVSWDDVFGGELSEPDSIASVKPPATDSGIQEHESSRNQKRKNGRDTRPKRNTVKHSYAESDTSEDMAVPSSVVGSKRKRNGTPPGDSPKKRAKGLGRSFSASTLQSSELHDRGHAGATQIKTTSSQPLAPSPSTPSRAFVRLGLHGDPPTVSAHDGYWWPAQVSSLST